MTWPFGFLTEGLHPPSAVIEREAFGIVSQMPRRRIAHGLCRQDVSSDLRRA